MNKLKTSVLSLSLLTVMAGAAVAPALGTISANFYDVSQTLIKLIITLPALMIILTSVVFSVIITKWKPKTIIIMGLILYTLGGACAGLVNDIYVILFFRILLGIGVGLIMPLSTALLSILFEDSEQEKLMGYSSAMNNLGGIIATSLSGVLVAMNWRYSFLIYLLGFIVFFMILKNLPNIELHDTTDRDKKGITSISGKELKIILPYAISSFLLMIVFYALPSNFSMILSKTELVATSMIGLIMSVQNLTAFVIGLTLAKILSVFKKLTPYIGIVSIIVGYVLESLLASVPATVIGLICIGAGLGLFVPIINSQISHHIPRNKMASAMSVMSAFLFLGQFLSPIIIDFFVNVFHLQMIQAPYYIAIVGAAILFVFTLGLVKIKQ